MFNRFNGDRWSLLYCDGKLIACGSRQSRFESGWSLLYQDGKLVVSGDSYYTDEYISNFVGVVDEGYISVSKREDIPKTLEGARALQQGQKSVDLAKRELAAEIAAMQAELDELERS